MTGTRLLPRPPRFPGYQPRRGQGCRGARLLAIDADPGIPRWVAPAGIIGGRIYFDITTPADMPHVWHGPLAVWTGALDLAALRLNVYIAILMTLAALTWFALVQRRPDRPAVVLPATGNPAQDTGHSPAEPPAPVRNEARLVFAIPPWVL